MACRRLAVLAIYGGLIGAVGAGERPTWPTLHKDYQRSGYTDEVLAGPFERKWYRDLHDEMIATRVEAIVAGGKCFVGTFAGNLHALDVTDGRTAWTFRAAGPIGASPCWADGRVFVGADEGFAAGHLYCLSAADGALVWKYDAGAGLWASPACVGGVVYVGDRAGVFHAVSAAEGKRLWTFRTGGMVLKPASVTKDGKRIVVGSEDMHVYCLSPAGKLLWKSAKLAGLSMRDQGATIWRGLAIVRTNPADGFHTVLGRNGDLLKRTQLAIPRGPEDKVLMDKWNDLLLHPTPRRRKAEQDAIVRYLRENSHDRTFHALDLADGSEPWIASVFYTAGLHNPPTPPTFHPETGELYTFYRTALTYYLRGVRRYNALARIRREDGRADFVYPEQRHDAGRAWYGMPMIGDETQALSLMGDWLIATHQGDIGALNVRTEKVMRIWTGRDSYGGIFGPATVPGGFQGAKKLTREGYLTGMPNEWHGPDRSIAAIAEGRVFWVVGSQVVCLAGPDVPKAATGGTRPPKTFKKRLPAAVAGGNVAVAGAGAYDERLKKEAVAAGVVSKRIERMPKAVRKHAATPLAGPLRALLAAEVRELVEDGPWAPFVVELGISREERHFWRTAETIQIVALALPHLSPPVRAKAKAFLDRMVEHGCPLDRPVHDPSGKRREAYDLGPGMRAFAAQRPRHRAGIGDVYALWAYAHYADGWEKLLPLVPRIKALLGEAARRGVQFDGRDRANDAAERLNRQIAGVLAAARILRRAGYAEDADRARDLLAQLLTERIHHERADTDLIRGTGGRVGHHATVPRYVGLVPELAAVLGKRAGGALERNVRSLTVGLPVWYQAFGERMIGGENYISPPHLSRGLFAALADGLAAPPDALAAKLDHPWCKADLYAIEKTAAVLRRLE